MIDVKLRLLHNSGSFKKVIYKIVINDIYLLYMYKQDLALNNLQWLIFHKTKENNCCFPNI